MSLNWITFMCVLLSNKNWQTWYLTQKIQNSLKILVTNFSFFLQGKKIQLSVLKSEWLTNVKLQLRILNKWPIIYQGSQSRDKVRHGVNSSHDVTIYLHNIHSPIRTNVLFLPGWGHSLSLSSILHFVEISRHVIF